MIIIKELMDLDICWEIVSGTSKTLTVTIDGTPYNIVFNTDLTAQTDEYVIGLIDAVIGAVADTDIYAVGLEYYPKFKGTAIKINADTTAILAGMGVVFNGTTGVKIATNADGHIDGIALDNFAVGQEGRIIEGGLYLLLIHRVNQDLRPRKYNCLKSNRNRIGNKFFITWLFRCRCYSQTTKSYRNRHFRSNKIIGLAR